MITYKTTMLQAKVRQIVKALEDSREAAAPAGNVFPLNASGVAGYFVTLTYPSRKLQRPAHLHLVIGAAK